MWFQCCPALEGLKANFVGIMFDRPQPLKKARAPSTNREALPATIVGVCLQDVSLDLVHNKFDVNGTCQRSLTYEQRV